MKKRFSLYFVIGVLFLCKTSIAQIVTGNLFLQGAYLETGMQRNGALGTSVNQPSGYHHHGGSPPCGGSTVLASVYDWGKDGWTTGSPAYMGDYTLPGSPWEEWAIQVAGTMCAASSSACGFGGSLTGSHTSYSNVGGRATGIWTGTTASGALAIRKEHRIDTFGSALIITVVMTNTTASPLTGVYYMRTCDPDNNQTWSTGTASGSFGTDNMVIYQNDYYHRVMVTAKATATGTGTAAVLGTPPCEYSLGTKDCRAKALIYTSWPLSCTNLATIWAGSAGCLSTSYYTPGVNHYGDIAIGLVYNIGTIAAYDSAVISYAYIYNGTVGIDSAFPEPQMVVNGTVIDSIDTVTSCMVGSGTTMPVDLINADDKCWTWGEWTWAPAVGLATTTGVHNVVDFSAITSMTTYTITGVDTIKGNCVAKTFLLTVIPVTVATPIVHDTSFCLNFAAGDISACAIGTYLQWYTSATGGTGTTVAPTPVTTALGITTYYVAQVVSGCTSVRVPVTVTITDAPVVTLSNNGPLCPGNALNVTLTDPTSTTGTYNWSGPGGFSATSHDVNIGSCVFADSGVYTVVADYAGCSTAPTSSTVVVHSTPPSPGITNPTYCQYVTSSPLTATGSNILWYTSATGGTASTTAPTPSTTYAGTFTFYVTQTVNGCESNRYPVTVTINPKPVPPTISNNPGAYCPNASFGSYTYATGTGSVLWYAASSGGTGNPTPPTVNTAVPGTYTFWASQTLLGCEGDRSPVTIVVYDSVKAHYYPVVHWGCHGDTVVFNNTSYGAVNYLWDFGDGTSSAVANPTHIFPNQGVYTIRLYSHSYTCVDSTIQVANLVHPDTSRFTLTPSIACQNAPVSFTNSSIATTPTYLWIFGDGTTSTAANPSHIFTNTGTYEVSLVVSDFVPCSDTSHVTVTIDTLSPVHLSISDTAMCRGTYISLSADFSSIGNNSLVWYFGNGDTVYNTNPVSYAFPAVGTYTITATARYRVCADANASQVVYIAAQPAIDLGVDTSICVGSESTLYLWDHVNAAATGTSWLWSTGETTPSIGVATSGMYYATVTIGGCSATDSVWVGNDCYVSVPNCFTPNKDGVNDYFNPRDYFTKGCKHFNLTIYNRWGQKLFETANLEGSGWDGMYNNVQQPEGVYIYTLNADFVDGQKITKQGNITIVR